jgi:hypothetical protein
VDELMATPKPKVFWPIAIDATNNRINFKVGATPYAATIASATYYSATDLCAAVDVALTAALAGAWDVGIVSGKVAIGYTSPVQFLFLTGANAATSARHVLGFGAIDTVAASWTFAPLQHLSGWYSDRSVAFDSKAIFEPLVAVAVANGGQHFGLDEGERELRVVEFKNLPAWKTRVEREGPNLHEAIERWWRDGRFRFRYWPDSSDEATFKDYCLHEDVIRARFDPSRLQSKEAYSLRWTFRRYVA